MSSKIIFDFFCIPLIVFTINKVDVFLSMYLLIILVNKMLHYQIPRVHKYGMESRGNSTVLCIHVMYVLATNLLHHDSFIPYSLYCGNLFACALNL